MNEPFPDARALLRKHQLGAKKSWGQNFLISERAYRAIVDSTVRSPDDWSVEFGAGLGTLTSRLAPRVPEGKVIAVERYRVLVAVLERVLGLLDNVDIAPAKALTFDLPAVARWRGEPIAVCGNLPYHLSSQLVMRIIDARRHVTHAVVMLQREMADRFAAAPGTTAYGAIGVMVSTYADVSTVLQLDPSAFVPRPKVDSTIVRLTMLPDGSARVPIDDHAHYSRVVHAAFHQRRKTLRNALRAQYPEEAVDRALAAVHIDGGRRGETLSIEEFARLAHALDEHA